MLVVGPLLQIAAFLVQFPELPFLIFVYFIIYILQSRWNWTGLGVGHIQLIQVVHISSNFSTDDISIK